MMRTVLKKILLGTVTALSLVAAPCAAVPRSELSLGGIPLRQKYSVDDVKRIYGTPTRESYGIMEYGDSVEILSDEAMISCIQVTEDNGWATPAGVHVGMAQEKVLSLYGQPDESAAKGKKTLHIYFDDDKRCVLGIVYGGNGKAALVTVKTSLMADFESWFPRWKERILN